ncbi:SMC5-SMC6 complex localization factor protein 2 isoform X2 [Conger conger]|uniref:SMC5-SMC6 complex localization factor protein 2 isoform X2 n=1 Tax=Conger conger TaxID=82655 RepID=UPI002A5AA79F|nr:SMC5-SMC6 complex localization factor protein 2 isoform X2 [Conger conger]
MNGIIPGDVQTDAKCTSPHPSHKTSVKSGNLLNQLNPKVTQAVPLKSPELEPKPKPLTSDPPSWSQAIGVNRDGSTVPRAHPAKPYDPTDSPSIKIGTDAVLLPIMIGRSRSRTSEGARLASLSVCGSRQGGPPSHQAGPPPSQAPASASRQEKDSWRRRRSLDERNAYCKSKERSCHLVTSPRGSSMVPGCAKRKGEHVVEDGRDRKRPCFQDLGQSFQTTGCEPASDHSLKLRRPQGVGVPKRSPPRPATPAPQPRRGLEPPSREVRKGTPVPNRPCPRPDRGGPKSSRQSPRRTRDPQATRGRSSPRRADRPERGATPLVPCSVVVTRLPLSPPATAGRGQPHASASPLVSLASGGGNGGTNISPLAGSCFPESPAEGAAKDRLKSDGPETGSGEDPDLSDLELDLEAFAKAESSSESDDEPLLSLQEILERSARVPATPEKGAYPVPDQPVHKLPVSKLPPQAGKSRPVSYKNTLEQILKEKEEKQRWKEAEPTLLSSEEEDLLKLSEDGMGDGPGEEGISQEHRAILNRFSLVSNGIPDAHPGEAVFTGCRFGRFFSQQSLDLRSCAVVPQDAHQKTLLQASPDELLFLISTRKLLKAYHSSPCQPAVTRWLFQMMSVHSDRETSTQILRAMTDIAFVAADQITVNKSREFEVWTPSIQDIVVVFLNMGVSFTTLFPPEALQPSFTEADILQSTRCLEVASSREQEPDSFPEHCFENVMKYLALCMALCPRAYSDGEVLLLVTLVSRVSLETCLQLLPMEDSCWVLHHLLNNTRDWACQLPRICLALVDLTENHHNLRRLVQLLPDHRRGKQLRKHLSMSIISKLLNRRCTYKPVTTEFQLSALQRYLPRMKPSSLLTEFFLVKKTEDQREEEEYTLSQDQQAYYLCYSLLTLINEASNFDAFPINQKEQLKLLSAELEKYVKGDIREGEQWLYRSKVKDLVARIYTRWQVLLHKSRPTQGKLHDYWQPSPEDTLSSSKEQAEPEAVTNTDPHPS